MVEHTIHADTLMLLANDRHVHQVSLAPGRYTGLDLSGVRFEGVNASQVIFENCLFTESNWHACRLDGTRFERSALSGSSFTECAGVGLTLLDAECRANWWQGNQFTHADFTAGDLDDLAASSCDLSSARLPHRLEKAWISACKMPGVVFSKPPCWHQVQILESELQAWDLSGASFTQCAFVRCALEALRAQALQGPYLSFWHCNLHEADLSQAQLEGANFESADLSRATLNGSRLVRARLVRAQTRGAHFIKADLTQVDASYLDAANANFTESQWELANVHGAQLEQANWTNSERKQLRLTDPALHTAEQWRAAHA